MSLTQVTPDVISTNTISGLISQGFNTLNVASMNVQTISSGSANTLTLRANNTTAITVDTSGNVGISNTTPLALLTVNSAANTTSLSGTTLHLARDTNTIVTMDSYGGSAQIIGRTALGSSTTPSALLNDRALLTIGARGFANTAFTTTVKSFIGIYSGENWTDSAQGTYISFHNTPAGSTTRAEVMRISANNNVGIGITTPTQKLEVTGSIKLNSGVVIGERGTAAAPAYSFSDDTDTGMFNISNADLGFSVGGTERVRIDSNGQVAIGSSSADPFSTVNTRMVGISSSGGGTTTALNITSGAGSRIQFGIGTTRTAVIYSDSTNYTAISTETALPLVFVTNQTERMRIDSSGNVGIGTNSPSSYGSKLAILANQNSQLFAFLRNDSSGSSSASAIALNAYGNTWGMEIGSAAKNNNSLTWQLDYGGTNAERLRLTTDGTLILRGGSTSATGTGITFPASQAASSDANTLDDYEEGSWTPTLGGFSSVNYNYRLGTYIKIGRMAYVFWDFDVSSRSGSWNNNIEGLPFTVSGTMAGYSVALHRDSSIFNTGVSGTQLKGFVNQNTTYIAVQIDNSGTSGFGFSGSPGVNASGRSTGCVMYMTSN